MIVLTMPPLEKILLSFLHLLLLLFSLLSLTFRLLDFHSIQFREILRFDTFRNLHRTITSQLRIQNVLHMIILLLLYRALFLSLSALKTLLHNSFFNQLISKI